MKLIAPSVLAVLSHTVFAKRTGAALEASHWRLHPKVLNNEKGGIHHRRRKSKSRSKKGSKLSPAKSKEQRQGYAGYRRDQDGAVVTYEEMMVKHRGKVSEADFPAYWKDSMTPVQRGSRGTFDSREISIGEGAGANNFPLPWDVRVPKKSGRPEDPKKTKLGNILRFLNSADEKNYPRLQPMLMTVSKQYDGKVRLTSPFEHVCGGNQEFNKSSGHNGRSNFISFLNEKADKDAKKDCRLYYDKGQRRTKIRTPHVGHGATVIDLSSYDKALAWCYHGGIVRTEEHEIEFPGAKDVAPFPFLCATSAWQTRLKCRNCGQAPDEWWDKPYNRKLIAHKCAEWASVSLEVVVMPDPDRILGESPKNWVDVETDREPVKNKCFAHLKDRCLSIDKSSGTACCCSDPNCTKDPDERCPPED